LFSGSLTRSAEHAGSAAHPWFALDRATIADIACYPDTGAIGEGNISLQPFPAIRDWVTRADDLPGFVAMPKFAAG